MPRNHRWFDPIERAGALWEHNWPGQPAEVYHSMRAVTSVMRAQQILIAELDAMLRPYGITFSRYEALVLLMYSRRARCRCRRSASGCRCTRHR